MYSLVRFHALSAVPSQMRLAVMTGLALFAAGFCATASATVLIFDEIRLPDGSVVPTISGNPPEPDYGDRVTGSPMDVPGGQFTYGNEGEGFTPNVVADFFVEFNRVSLWQTDYGDLTNVLIGGNNSLSLNVLLTADEGFEVLLYHFVLAGWPNADYTIDAVRVMSGPDTLFSASDVLVEGDFDGPRHTTFDFPIPLVAAELLIQIDYGNLAGGQQDNVGIDSIRFGQNPPAVVPLPAALALFLGGLAALALRGRRRGLANS